MPDPINKKADRPENEVSLGASGWIDTKVVLVERIFTTYRKAVYDLISQRVELKLLHGRNNSGVKTTQTEYSQIIPHWQFGKKETNVLLFPLGQIVKNRPKVVILDFALGVLNLPVIIFFSKLFKIKIAFWSHGYNRKTGFHPRQRWVDKYRLWLMKRVDAHIVYSTFDKKVLSHHINRHKIFVAQNTLDTNYLNQIRTALLNRGRESVKSQLGISHPFNICFIGRMLPDKKPELLLDVYEILKNEYHLTPGVHFIGEGPMLPLIKEKVEQRGYSRDFYFHGAVYDDQRSGALLFSCDMMVMPGYLGLSVNHAFCFDCPVLSFETVNGFPAHSPEVEYVVHNKTGFLVKKHSARAIAACLYDYLTDEKMQQAFKRNIRYAVTRIYPLARMVEGVLACINFLENENDK